MPLPVPFDAKALLGSPDRAFQESLAKEIVADGLSVRQAEEAVRRALTLDESLAAAHAMLGAIRLQQLDIPASHRSLERANALNPGPTPTTTLPSLR